VDRSKLELDDIFCAAMDLALPAERAAYLDQACGADLNARQRVQRLLDAHAQAGSFLGARPAVAPAAASWADQAIGSTIGPYKLLEQIGEGGMGVVFMAEQSRPLRRKVALKVIKPGMDSKQVIARFEAERQALALMDHPNIARVLDGGTTDSGQPFFAMDLVRGIPITEYCDQARWTPRQRLELFQRVCLAVQHAHQRGIIHRDLKPGNVLVTLQDGEPVPKVIDFGIAKATGEQLTDKTLFTCFTQMVGTPLYMSPEQAALSATEVDTRTDVYALGVLLYELLTGTTPFDSEELKKANYDEMRRIIREEEPPRPSQRLTTMEQASLSTICECRSAEPRKLSLQVRGELDWVVMKALEKDRDRRYESASALAADVQRYLNEDAVEACPPSAGYRLRKYMRRNRRLLVPVAVIGTVLIAATGISTWLAIDSIMARRNAATDGAIARAVNDFLAYDLLAQVNVAGHLDEGFEPDRNLTVREALDRAAAKVPKRFRDQPLVEAAIREAVGTAYLGVGRTDLAVNHLEVALALRRLHRGPGHRETLWTICRLAESYTRNGQLREALALQGASSELFMATIPESEITSSFLGGCARACYESGKFDESESWNRTALELHLKNKNEFGAACALVWLTRILLLKKQFSAAEITAREALMHLPKDPAHAGWVFSGALGDALLGQGKYQEAEPLLFKSYEGLKERFARLDATTQDWRVTEASERIARFYEATNQPEKAAAFRERNRTETRKK
jgi:eukaryotic-like serine/threonine-protein kinase